jgi:kynurenine 3-monooxygenase
MSNQIQTQPDFTILGSGLAGTLMAVYLARQGFRTALYERNGDMRNQPVPRGRSINLALSHRGLHALREVGLADELLDLAIPMRGRMMHSVTGELTFQPYGRKPDEVIYSISRHRLNCALLEAAERLPNVEIFFNQKCIGADISRNTVEIEDTATHKTRTLAARTFIGADGAFSAVRQGMNRIDRFNYSQDFLSHGYKELTIPALPDGSHALDKHCLHIWPRHDFMLIALPNQDGTFTCTLFLAHEGEYSFARLTDEDQVMTFFSRHFPDAVPLMPDLVDDFFHNPTGAMVTVRCFPWQYNGRFALVGDAAHAVVPFYGQGMNASFEDCSVLNECLQRHNGDTLQAFQEYQNLRKANTDALSVLAFNNFLEMRDKVASRTFLLRKKLENLLAGFFPGKFIPLYTMVSFSRIPYAEATAKAARQDRLINNIGYGLLALVGLGLLGGLVGLFG